MAKGKKRASKAAVTGEPIIPRSAMAEAAAREARNRASRANIDSIFEGKARRERKVREGAPPSVGPARSASQIEADFRRERKAQLKQRHRNRNVAHG